MKKLVLLCSLLAIGLTVKAQDRLVLYEEFTGENCPPCASTNPPLVNLMEQNSSKIVMISYMSPIPSAGQLSNASSSYTTPRLQYYSVNFAPWGDMDGGLPPGIPASQQNAHHPGYVNQMGVTPINQAANVASPFEITIDNFGVDNNGAIQATISVKAVDDYSGQNVKLRAVLVQTKNFTTAPGRNGEKDFHNMVMGMFPNASGQALPADWTTGELKVLDIDGTVNNSFFDVNGDYRLVVWVQDDGNKKVLQTGISDLKTGPTGINDVSFIHNSLQLVPNPVVKNLTVNISMVKPAQVNFTITNILGQQISQTVRNLTQGENKTTVETNTLTPGVYFLTVQEGQHSVQRKFIKK